MSQIQESPANSRIVAAEPSIFFCKDCKSGSPVSSLIPVDALHLQCPLCLYVFFRETAVKAR